MAFVVHRRPQSGFVVPGLYEAALRRLCVTSARARLALMANGEVVDRAPMAERESVFVARLAAGEPVEIPRLYIKSGMVPDGAPDWLRLPVVDGGARVVRVHSDDVVEPAYASS
jgi:hypothetical protein